MSIMIINLQTYFCIKYKNRIDNLKFTNLFFEDIFHFIPLIAIQFNMTYTSFNNMYFYFNYIHSLSLHPSKVNALLLVFF